MMCQAALSRDEAGRIALLHALDILDTPPEPAFDSITRLASQALRMPIALISLPDNDRLWFKSRVGLEASEVPRELAFCSHVILQHEPLVIGDATLDPRFADNPLVTGEPHLRFYAGMPIRCRDSLAIGALCVIDTRPRMLSADEMGMLADLADLVGKEIRLREALLSTRDRIDRTESAFRKSEARFQTMFERAGDGIAMLTPDGAWVRVNQALCDIVGYPAEELTRLTFRDITYPPDIGEDLRLHKQLLDGSIDRYRLEKRYLRKDGRPVWISLSVTLQTDADGTPGYLIAIIKNIQARKETEASLAALRNDLEARVEARTRELREVNAQLSQSMADQACAQQALRKREAELSAVIENATDAYVCIDTAGVVNAWNRQAQETFGWRAEEAVGRALDELIIPPPLREAHRAGMRRYLQGGESRMLNRRIELTAIRRDGNPLPVEIRIRAIDLDGQVLFSAFLHDITERKQAEEAREREARFDALTGLINRRALFELLPRAIARADRDGRALALCFIDLDGFKAVNDRYGHEAGDALLCEVSLRMVGAVRQTDTVARLAGDEFILLLEGLAPGENTAQDTAGKVLASIRQPVTIGGDEVCIGASIGIAVHMPGDERQAEQMLRHADQAMYEAKHAGKSQICCR